MDTNFQAAFPSLAPAAAPVASAPKSAWGADAGPRIKPSVARQPVFTDTFTLAAIELTASGRDQRPPTLGEVMKQVMTKYKVKLDASRNERTRQTTFHVKADTQKELDKAKRSLLALLSPVVCLIYSSIVLHSRFFVPDYTCHSSSCLDDR